MATNMFVHKAGQDFVGRIEVSEEYVKAQPVTDASPPQMVFIIDNSGSMGDLSRQVVQGVFPLVLEKIGYALDDEVTLIVFSSAAESFKVKVGELQRFDLGTQGGTYMKSVFEQLVECLDPNNPRVELLALSDGHVFDQEATVQVAEELSVVANKQFQIEAKAVRLKTGCGEPDTRALASVLQFNTHGGGSILDVGAQRGETSEAMALEIQEMWDSKVASTPITLKSDKAIFKREPWLKPTNELALRRGENTFWLTEQPELITMNSEPIKIEHGEALTTDTMAVLLKDVIDHYISRVKVLNVVGTTRAREQMSLIVSYFKNLEMSLPPAGAQAELLQEGGLDNRARFLKHRLMQRMSKGVVNTLESIANDDRVATLNESQQADYLRTLDVSRNAKGLARRAAAAGTEFDQTIRREIRAMREHLDQLEDIDAQKHEVSFYSQATTLDGIRAVCDMVPDAAFGALSALELLQMLNIVGVPAATAIGDYPDPMTYRLDRLLPGCYVSVADLTIAEMHRNGRLKAPGTDVEITNAVPVFDDDRIQKFLQTYAPSTLEYTCSIGMRRVLAEVPKTFPYTVCAGIWRLVGDLDTNRSDLHVNLLRRMLPSYHESLQGYFDYLQPLLEGQGQDPTKSFFLNFNGVTNMISPIWTLVKQNKTQHLPRILRALYTFEVYQAIRRFCKHKGEGFWQQALDSLLGVDFDKHKTPLPPMFQRHEGVPEHHDEAMLDGAMFKQLCALFDYYLKFTVLLAPLMAAVLQPDPVKAAKGVATATAEAQVAALALEYPLNEFLLYNVVEGFLYQTKQSRVDKDSNTPLRPDLGDRQAGVSMVREYVRGRYASEFDSRLRTQAGEEKKQLTDDLVAMLVQEEDLVKFLDLMHKGLARGCVAVKMAGLNSQGRLELGEALRDMKRDVPLRMEKLFVYYTGCVRGPNSTRGAAVWNGGNMLRERVTPLRDALTTAANFADEKELQRGEFFWGEISAQYTNNKCHVYRAAPNRHGHHNNFPSYYALGHNSLADFADVVRPEELKNYLHHHRKCCGVADYLDGSQSRLARKLRKRAADPGTKPGCGNRQMKSWARPRPENRPTKGVCLSTGKVHTPPPPSRGGRGRGGGASRGRGSKRKPQAPVGSQPTFGDFFADSILAKIKEADKKADAKKSNSERSRSRRGGSSSRNSSSSGGGHRGSPKSTGRGSNTSSGSSDRRRAGRRSSSGGGGGSGRGKGGKGKAPARVGFMECSKCHKNTPLSEFDEFELSSANRDRPKCTKCCSKRRKF